METDKKRPKFNEIEVEKGDLQNIVDLTLTAVKSGRPANYEDSPEGLEAFKKRTIEYFEYLDRVNATAEERQTIVPDTENYCVFMKISRMCLLNYEKNRNEEWQNFIQMVKTAITASKKQLAFKQKIPTVLAIFDLCNNSNYVNSSEFKLEAQSLQQEPKQITASELPILKAPTDEDVVDTDTSSRTAKILSNEDLPKL
jgi:hypothetical protein